ncbi:syntaxin-binding 4 isoform X3 [Pelobates cultripes]|uniref:Syntaxin-binding 4 isoform X3 n=1 Tax=Pelobates cultripes TaxID=61616 RepID=A0AAD1S577_PELCU|nr:syntaxin-binding 4 isoform X3 [Pelobates cultripes]
MRHINMSDPHISFFAQRVNPSILPRTDSYGKNELNNLIIAKPAVHHPANFLRQVPTFVKVMAASTEISKIPAQLITVAKQSSLGLSLAGEISRTEGPLIYVKDIIPGGDCHTSLLTSPSVIFFTKCPAEDTVQCMKGADLLPVSQSRYPL